MKAIAYFEQDPDGQIDVHVLIPSEFKDKTDNGLLVNIQGVPFVGSFGSCTDALKAAKAFAANKAVDLDVSDIERIILD